MSSLVLAILAGLLTSLSPCVIPVLPLVVGSAASGHRLGSVALCAGLVLSFSVLGVGVALAVRAFGFEPGAIRIGGAVLLLLLGAVLLVPRAQELLSGLLAPFASLTSRIAPQGDRAGLTGNFLTGTLLGAIWSPCAGPTLGAAIGLATQAKTSLQGFVLMFGFGSGASLPLLMVAYGSRTLFQKNKGWLIGVSNRIKPVFGVILLVVSMGVLTGYDKKLESTVLRHLPDSWLDLTTRY
jgi:cytochrome c biogenesis protein CcdA